MKSYKSVVAILAISGTAAWMISSDNLKNLISFQGAINAPCFHSTGKDFSYRLSYVLSTSTEQAGRKADPLMQFAGKQQVELAGLLAMHPISTDSVSVSFSPTTYKIQGHDVVAPEREFKEPIELKVDEFCQITEIAFDGEQSFRSREFFRSVLGLSVLDQRILSNSTLDLVESDIQGGLAVSYTRNGNVITKTRKSVVTPSQSRGNRSLHATFLESDSKFHLSDSEDAPRIRELTAKEITRITNRDTNESALQGVHLTLRPSADQQIAHMGRIPASRKVIKKPNEAFAGKDSASAYSSTEMRSLPSANQLKDALSEFEELLSKGDTVNAKKKLGAFLLRNPDALSSLNNLMADGDFTDEESMHLLFLLARIDHPNAQQVIVNLIENTDAPALLRIQSIMAVSDVMKPGEDVKKLLKDLATNVANTDQSDSFDMKQRMFNTAINSYGTMAQRLREIDPLFEADAVDRFKDLMKDNAASPDILQAVLDGAGNFAHEDLLEPISTHLDQASVDVRTSAASAIARIDDDRAEDLLVEKLQHESHKGVRHALAQGLAGRVHTVTPKNLPVIASALQQEPVAETRSKLVEALGRAAARPEAKQALIDAAAKESNSGVIQQIGRYVSASELSEQVSRRR